MITADRMGASIIIANDPDADRFAAAEKLPSSVQLYQTLK
jgi:phosphomannomutase